MIAGQLSLFGMNGIFFKGMLHSSPHLFETKEQQGFDGAEDFDTPEDDLESRFYFTPVDVDGVTEYITGSFQDDFKRGEKYRVTIWLLIEECTMCTDNTENS